MSELLPELVERTSLTEAEAEELYQKTQARISEVVDEDEYADVRSQNELNRMTDVAVTLVVRLSRNKETFPSEWEKFILEVSDFEVGLIYQSTFPNRAEESLERAHRDYQEGRL
ncbi:hypothetical protein M199_gp218 [Halogranum tailed virus 1]|uniref:Uncharacterized protein n=1 Tax=Halogranum tailed virus 1 TaxID=1273749 RepID=R4TMP7_9CAUD|nr:hypothetical protein M199_gp218 [Halogranum tailed virus 1]AGM11448.1 hypothetical protein HGTV1_151 [Halogranum tailed virus 1]